MSRSLAPLSARAAAVLAGLLFACAAAALDRGEFQSGLYTAPGELFTVQSPLGPNPVVIDSFDRAAGAVTFVDEAGALYGVVCTPNYDVLAGADNDAETDLAILRNWFRDATFPLFFESQLPGAAILYEEPVEFEGMPAWFGVDVPAAGLGAIHAGSGDGPARARLIPTAGSSCSPAAN